MLDFAAAETRYGAPYLLLHRGDLHAALHSAVPTELSGFDKKLVGLEGRRSERDLAFCRRQQRRRPCRGRRRRRALTRARVPARRREAEVHRPRRAPHRVPDRRRWSGFALDTCTKWWGPDRHIVTYPVTGLSRRDLLRHQRARPRLERGVLVDRGRHGRGATVRLPAFTPTCSGCSTPAGASTSGRCSSAIPCRPGLKGPVGPPGRCLPPDDALHGPGRRQLARGRRHARALSRGSGRPCKGGVR